MSSDAHDSTADTDLPVELRSLADAIRATSVETVRSAYEEAGVRGLCAAGRLEVAIDAARTLDVEKIVRDWRARQGVGSTGARGDGGCQ